MLSGTVLLSTEDSYEIKGFAVRFVAILAVTYFLSQRYIDRLRRNTPYLSEWKKQLSGSAEPPPQINQQQQMQLTTSFLDTPQLHSHQGSLVEALWSLRDNLIKDSLNIRTRVLGFEEL